MKIVEIPHGLVLAANEPDYVRSPGLHMSTLYGELYKKIDPKRYDKKTAAGDDAPFDVTIMEEGMAFEAWLEPQLRKRLLGERPGEFFTQHAQDCIHRRKTVKDGRVICPCGAGIAYSPDWLFYEPDPILGEFKRTKLSMKGAPRNAKFEKFICQMEAYCYHLRILRARLLVLFINGDYSYKSPGGDEQIRAWEFTFAQKELDTNWKTLKTFAQRQGMFKEGWVERHNAKAAAIAAQTRIVPDDDQRPTGVAGKRGGASTANRRAVFVPRGKREAH